MASSSKIAIEISLDTSRFVADLRAAGDALHAAADRIEESAGDRSELQRLLDEEVRP